MAVKTRSESPNVLEVTREMNSQDIPAGSATFRDEADLGTALLLGYCVSGQTYVAVEGGSATLAIGSNAVNCSGSAVVNAGEDFATLMINGNAINYGSLPVVSLGALYADALGELRRQGSVVAADVAPVYPELEVEATGWLGPRQTRTVTLKVKGRKRGVIGTGQIELYTDV